MSYWMVSTNKKGVPHALENALSSYNNSAMTTQPPASTDGKKKVETLELDLFPPPKNGLHQYVYGQACQMRDREVDPAAATRALIHLYTKVWNLRDGREASITHDIKSAVENAYAVDRSSVLVITEADAVGSYDATDGWPWNMLGLSESYDEATSAEVIARSEVRCVEDLTALSGPIPELPIRSLFPEHALTCFGHSTQKFYCSPLSGVIDVALKNSAFVVPNPMRALRGRVKSRPGLMSGHTRDNTGPRRFLIVEFDKIESRDRQAALLWELGKSLPLACVVSSGGKSVHGWFFVEGVDPAQLKLWFRTAVATGADPRMWFPEQFARMPNGTRDNGKRQDTLYFNLSATT